MTRSIKDFNTEIATNGYTLHANFSFSRWNEMTTPKSGGDKT